jgi:hypothetical protein
LLITKRKKIRWIHNIFKVRLIPIVLALILVYIVRCYICKAKKKSHCYHWTVGDEDSVVRFQAELQEMLEEYVRQCGSCFQQIKNKTKIIYNPTEINHFGNMCNIEFDVMSDDDDADIKIFNSVLHGELLLWNLPTYGNLTVCRKRLLQHVKTENRLARIPDAILWTAEGKEAALMLIKQAIP